MRVLPAASVTVTLVGATVTPFVSLSVMVPVAVAVEMVAPVASLSSTRKVSSPSSTASFVVATVKVLLASPIAKFNVCFVVCAV